ncbi:MAG TPA: YciI family protein [bacterium]
MKEFLYLYRGNVPPTDPEEAKKMTQKWIDWITALGKQGHLKARGERLESQGRSVTGKPGALNDGPFAEAKDVIGGYSLILANDLDQAAQLAKGCPIFERGGFVEVRPVLSM